MLQRENRNYIVMRIFGNLIVNFLNFCPSTGACINHRVRDKVWRLTERVCFDDDISIESVFAAAALDISVGWRR